MWPFCIASMVVVAAARRELVSYWSDGRRVGRAVNARGGASRARKVLVRSSARVDAQTFSGAENARSENGEEALQATSRLLERGRIERGTVKVKRREYVIVRYEQTKLAMSRTV